jgi:hypothetical protein
MNNCIGTQMTENPMDCQSEPIFKGYRVEISDCQEKPSRFSDCYLGKLYFVGHKNYTADEYPYETDVNDYYNTDDFMEALKEELPKDSIIDTVYMYSHGSDTISRSSFADRWDSGWIGVFVVTPQDVMNLRGWDSMDEEKWKEAKEDSNDTFAAWKAWVEGEVYDIFEVWESDHIESTELIATSYGEKRLHKDLDWETIYNLANDVPQDEKDNFIKLGKLTDEESRKQFKALCETYKLTIPTVEGEGYYEGI